MHSSNPYAPPRSAVDRNDRNSSEKDIDKLAVSDKWKERFKAIAAAGGPKLRALKSLPRNQRRKVFSFNIVAFFFGPFYYVAKGMWKRGLALFALLVVALTAVELVLESLGVSTGSSATGVAAGTVYALRANVDYFKKMVLEDNGWW